MGASAAAASIGLINSVGNLGGFFGPYTIGWLSDKMGSYAGGLWAVATALFLSGIVVLLVRSGAKRIMTEDGERGSAGLGSVTTGA